MIVQKKHLLESLKAAMPGVDSDKAVLQGADTFVFHDGNIFTYNDFISVLVPINQIGIVSDIEGAVNGKDFFQIVNKMPSEEITFEPGDKAWTLKAGKSKVEMTLVEFDYKKRLEGITPDDSKWIKIDDDLTSGINFCKISQNKSLCSGVFFAGRQIIGTDGIQINRYNLNVELPKFWLSENCVDELLKINGFTDIQVNGTWAHFRSVNGTIFSAKTLNIEKYPLDKILVVLDSVKLSENDIHGKFPKALFGAIDRAISLSINLRDRQAVRLTLNKDGVDVSSERASGKYEENVPWDEEIKDFETVQIYVDAGIILNICSKASEFYIIPGKKAPRLFFKTEKSVHMMSTFVN